MKNNSLFYVLIASISGVLFGFDTGVISGAILFLRHTFHFTLFSESFLMSAVLIGAFLGALISSRVADILGRRTALIYVAIIFILGTLLSSLSFSMTSLICGRILIGVATGVSAYLSPLYISELAPAKQRGLLVSLNQLALVSGILLSYVICYELSATQSWRLMFMVGLLPAIILLMGLLFLPESPRWLIKKNRLETAKDILLSIRTNSQEAIQEFADIVAITKVQTATWRTLLKPPLNKTLFIACALTAMQQVTGINTILYFAPTILHMSGMTDNQTALAATIGIGLFLVASTILTISLIDKVGRKKLLYVGLSLMAIGLSGMIFSFNELMSMCAYIAGFAFALGAIVWLMIVEVFPLSVRGLGASIATSVNWFFNWLVTFSFLYMMNYLGKPGTFLVYLLLTLISIVFVYFFVPETKNISLENIEANLYSGKRCRELGVCINAG